VDGFAKKYDIDKLVYFEQHQTMGAAILRERQLKKWNREWKIKLIRKVNPDWEDLWFRIV